jgi:transposase InsO family protein
MVRRHLHPHCCGWAYTATVIDLYSRTVVGHAAADHLRTSLVTDALTAALATRKPPPRGDLPQRPSARPSTTLV